MKKLYRIHGKAVIEYKIIESTDGNTYMIDSIVKPEILIDDTGYFYDKEEAMKQKFREEIKYGNTLQAFKSSPYYKVYYELCKEEYPEQLI